jgi:hypothetical protein
VPEIGCGAFEFNTDLGFAARYGTHVYDVTKLFLSSCAVGQLKGLSLFDFSRNRDQSPMRVDDERARFLIKRRLPGASFAANGNRHAQDHALAAPAIHLRPALGWIQGCHYKLRYGSGRVLASVWQVQRFNE